MSKKDNTQSKAPEKVYDFCSQKKLILITVICLLVALILGIVIRGVNFAIEFSGGTELTYDYEGTVDINNIQSITNGLVGVPVNVRTGENLDTGGNQLTISFTSESGFNAEKQNELTELILDAYPDNNIQLFDSNDVTPSSGREFLWKCFVAIIFAAVVIIIYIAFRFKKIGGWSAGVCSVFALLHDLLAAITVSILFGFEFNANVVAVILTILGYSINNTIVIYDRVRENRSLMPKASLNELINASCTQSLTRSIRTSITTCMTMLIITIVVIISRYTSLLSFSVPLLFGLISGTYSSIFVAPVTWSWWENKKAEKEE